MRRRPFLFQIFLFTALLMFWGGCKHGDSPIDLTIKPCPPVQTIYLPGDVPLELIWIPAGSFMMGKNDGEPDSDESEGPRHQVVLPGFWLGKNELTKRQWKAILGTTPWIGHQNVLKDLDSPAECVSWNDALSFVSALNAHILSTGQGAATVRLPSESEWEYAARSETDTRFYWGDDLGYTAGNKYAWWSYNVWDDNEPYAHVGGLKRPNNFGLYDMSGNVYEWCQDDWHSSYKGAPANGSAWIDAPRARDRVVRGGCWHDHGSKCRSAYRFYVFPLSSDHGLGFRLAR